MTSLVTLALIGLFLMIAGVLGISRKAVKGVALVGLLVALIDNILEWTPDADSLSPINHLIFATQKALGIVPLGSVSYFNKMVVIDNYVIAFIGAIITVTIFLFLLSENYFNKIQTYLTEHYALFFFALVGMICMVSYNNLAMLFIGIEILSVSLFILAGSEKTRLTSNEASLKYFLMGAFATGILLMGMALVYGASGSFYLGGIEEYFTSAQELSPIAYVGMFLILIGMSFKVSIAPFHFWTPDVYDGSPTFVTSFMSTVVKIAGFAAFFKLFYICFSGVGHFWINVLAVMSGLTITVGGMSAVTQKSLKRLLAFSSVSHAGYMLMVVIVGANADDVFFYVIAYSVSSLMAFAVLMLIEDSTGNTDISSFDGLGKRNPLLALVMTVSMLSMAGIPLTAGFMAKFYVLSSAIGAGHGILVLVAILNAMVGIYYYFKVIIAMYFKESSSEILAKYSHSTLYSAILVLGIIATVLLGLCPDIVHNLI